MLDYDYELIQFTQLCNNVGSLAAIDQYGELWFLAGKEDDHTPSMGFDYESEESRKCRVINRPICSNHMRRLNKIALKV